MDFKRENQDFRYSIRNGPDNIRVIIKRISKYQNIPYRAIQIDCLGAISPFKPKTVDNSEENLSEIEEDKEGFQKTSKKLKRPNFLPKEEIYRNINAVLDGFSPKANRERRNSHESNSV